MSEDFQSACASKPDSVRDSKRRKSGKRSGIAQLLDYAGSRKSLTYLGMALSALSQLLSFGPYVCIWLVARDLTPWHLTGAKPAISRCMAGGPWGLRWQAS